MSYREQFRPVQVALGTEPTGIPNQETAQAWVRLWDNALAEYRASEAAVTGIPVDLPSIVIGPDHWIVGVKRMPLPPHGELKPLCVVEHFTNGSILETVVESMSSRGVSAHVVIDRDGTIVQCIPFNRIAYHCDPSKWKDPMTGQLYNGMNSHSIGIEINNAGNDKISWVERQPGYKSIQAKHRNGGSLETWEVFYEPQMASVRALTKLLFEKYGIHDVTGHDCIAPSRKNDPGPAFPMHGVRADVGLTGLPEVFR